MMSLPQLLDGLGRGRIDIVQRALQLHYLAFKSEFLYCLQGSANAQVEQHVNRMAVLFETILNHLLKCNKNSPFMSNVIYIVFDHIKKLQQDLHTVKATSRPSSAQQKKAVFELLDFYLKQLQKLKHDSNSQEEHPSNPSFSDQPKDISVAQVRNIPTSDKLKDTLSLKSDEDVVKSSLLSSDAVTCAQEILLSRGGRSNTEVAKFVSSTADVYILELLKKKQIEIAKDVLRNTDRDIWPSLKSICLNSIDSDIRDFLALELNSLSFLESTEVDAWKFLILVEGIVRTLPLKIGIKSGELAVQEESDLENGLSIAQLLLFPASSKSCFLMDLYFLTFNGTLEPMLVKEDCWNYLLLNEKLEILIKWVKVLYNKDPEPYHQDRVVTFLSSWDITQDMVQSVPQSKCSASVKDGLLDCLSKYGIYLVEECDSVQQHLSRAVRTSQILNGLEDKMKELFVNFCVDQNLPELMVSCELKTERVDIPWIKLFSDCQHLSQKIHFKSSFYESISVMADYLQISPSAKQWISVASYLLSEKAWDVAHDSQPNDSLENGESLREAEKDLPVCLTVLGKFLEETNSTDISFQSLLTKKYVADFSHLIQKQTSFCKMFKDGPNENEMDFSSESLITSHGLLENLDFQYFLKQERPCHAAMLVLSEMIGNFGKPPCKLLKKTSLLTHELAFCNIMDQKFTSSCIAFLEMLGQSSLPLRTHLATLRHITRCNPNGVIKSGPNVDNSELSWLHLTSGGKPIDPQGVLELLQSSVSLDIHMQGLCVQFANLHNLPQPTNFLVHCAQGNDWIKFLLFAQIYSCPLEVVQNSTRYFKSLSLRKHIKYFLSSDVAGMRALLKCTPESPKLRVTPKSSASEALSNRFIPAPSVFSCLDDDIFRVLLTCHELAQPAQALLCACIELPCPILAVLADYYQANIESQLIAWLVSWFPFDERVNFEWQKDGCWSPEVFETVILRSLEICPSNLLMAFKVFIPDHPFVLVLEVFEEPSSKAFMTQSLKKFKEFYLTQSQENSSHLSCLQNPSFVYSVGCKLLLKYFDGLAPVEDKRKLLQILCHDDICFFSADLSKLITIMDIISCTEVQVNVTQFIQDWCKEVHCCIERLVALQLFKKAVEIATVASLGNEDTFALAKARCMILLQTDKFQKWISSKYQDFKAFCADCEDCFRLSKVDHIEAYKFYSSCASKLDKNVDRWRAFHLAFKWLQIHGQFNSSCESAIDTQKAEIEMWQCCLDENNQTILNVLMEELEPSPLSSMCVQDLAINIAAFTRESSESSTICDAQQWHFGLLDCLLDIGDIVSAIHVKNLFQLTHQDIKILETCIALAEEKLNVEQIPTSCIYASPKLVGKTHQPPCSLDSSFKKAQDAKLPEENIDCVLIPPIKKMRILSTVQELCKQLKHGKQIGKQLLACNRLAVNLGLSYNEVISVKDPLKLLRTAISQVDYGDYSVASDIMTALRLSPSECAKFLSCEIISAISKALARGKVKDFLMWGHSMEQHFNHLLGLVPDPILLGNDLLLLLSKLAISEKSTPKEVLSTAVELLIRAHDCYAAGCHMEGVSQVLRSVNSFISILKARSEWSLMVRLLTGIQRYTEMNNIFKILKENDQFEFLLRKDSVKPLGFKLALLDWLRRECPQDTGLLKMTAAHFKMHKEEAELWEKEGTQCLSNLVKNELVNDQTTKSGLQTAIQDFSHASECYLQAGMLNHAMTSAHQAELVALQLHLLSVHSERSVLRVVMLDAKTISKLIVSTLSFNEALVVARAYNHRTDWAAALFYHCISPGLTAQEYFSSWSSCMELTPSLIQNIAYRFQRTPGVTHQMTSNMRWLLGHVQDIDIRYKIASELGLKDIVESLLQAPEIAYLKDTVWQVGFKK